MKRVRLFWFDVVFLTTVAAIVISIIHAKAGQP